MDRDDRYLEQRDVKQPKVLDSPLCTDYGWLHGSMHTNITQSVQHAN